MELLTIFRAILRQLIQNLSERKDFVESFLEDPNVVVD